MLRQLFEPVVRRSGGDIFVGGAMGDRRAWVALDEIEKLREPQPKQRRHDELDQE